MWERRRPLHPARLYAALDQLVPAAQRSRGRFWLANRPGMMLGWDAAGGSLAVDDCGPWLACLPDEEWDRYSPERRVAAAAEWDPRYGDRVQLLVFTAQGLDADGWCGSRAGCPRGPHPVRDRFRGPGRAVPRSRPAGRFHSASPAASSSSVSKQESSSSVMPWFPRPGAA
ncbi:MAG TPA: GTP-binding protein [Trebonia sp.]